jgi:hypothetical protein
VPADVTFELRLDRYILPARAVRQAILLYTNDRERTVFLEPEYDLVERVLLYRLPEGAQLERGLLYTLEIVIPKDEDDDGLRAFDGAPIEAGRVPLLLQFRTALREPDADFSARLAREPVPSCSEAVTIFNEVGCGSTSCHNAEDRRMGQILFSEQGLVTTAIGKVAHQTSVGPQGYATLENPLRLGVQMPRIDPGRPGNSYLLYKLLRKPENFSASQAEPACSSQHRTALPEGECPAPPQAERDRLREWFVRGEPMPFGGLEAGRRLMTISDLRKLQRWIAGGSPCP